MSLPEDELNEIREEFTRILRKQDYEYRHDIVNEKTLKANLRKQLEKLNSKISGKHFRFQEIEWTNFYKEYFERGNIEGSYKKTKLIQKGKIFELKRGYGSSLAIELIHRENLDYNLFQIIDSGNNEEINNDDLTVLINGFPIVHIEIRKGNISKGGFNKHKFYKQWGSLFEFLQIFIVSNGHETKYYTLINPYTRDLLIHSSKDVDPSSTTPKDLLHFSRTFFSRKTTLETIINYCDSHLKILRPYQIKTVQTIIERVDASIYGKAENFGGYVCYATGTGKTLTAFKAAQLVHNMPDVKKVVFVVDKADLDSQIQREYRGFMGKFYVGSIDNTENTEALESVLNSGKKQIIITTIQKLFALLNESKNAISKRHNDQRVVFILDECCKSTTPNILPLINTKFKKRNVFEFTSFPTSRNPKEEIYSYNLIEALNDKNVLEFCIDYVGNKATWDKEIDFQDPKRISAIVSYIIHHFETETINNKISSFGVVTKNRFSSLLTVESVEAAINYYKEFEKQIQEVERNLRVSILYSPDTNNKDQEEFLFNKAIRKYEIFYKQKIEDLDYYKELISLEFKKRRIDVLIVVDDFINAIDSPIINTIWIDRDLKDIQLMKTLSRTNRIYNEGKVFGNVVCFRNIEEEINRVLVKYSGEKRIMVDESEEEPSNLHENINPSEFNMEIIKSTEVNVDYIQKLLGQANKNKD